MRYWLRPLCCAEAQVEKLIVDPGSNFELGRITFPADSGSDPTDIEFDFSGFTEGDITLVSWALDPVTTDVSTLSLTAFMGDASCGFGSGPCSNTTLTLSETNSTRTGFNCPASGFCFQTSLGFPVAFVDAAPKLACIGFEPPLADGPVTVKKNKVLPLKAELLDADGFALGDGDLMAPPVVQVMYDSGIMGQPSVDVSDDALPAGQGMDGNLFVFSGSKWQFNLKTKNYEAPGSYTITMVSGDGAEYRVDPTCEAQFVIE